MKPRSASINLKGINTPYVRIFDNEGKEVPSQLVSDTYGIKEILFLAEVKSLGLKVFDARPSKEPCKIKSRLTATDNTIENQKYIVSLNKNGFFTESLGIEQHLFHDPLDNEPSGGVISLRHRQASRNALLPVWQ